jgi:hypothetical protein
MGIQHIDRYNAQLTSHIIAACASPDLQAQNVNSNSNIIALSTYLVFALWAWLSGLTDYVLDHSCTRLCGIKFCASQSFVPRELMDKA